MLIDLHFPDAGSLTARRKDLAAAATGGGATAVEQGADRVERDLDGRLPQGYRIERVTASSEEVL